MRIVVMLGSNIAASTVGGSSLSASRSRPSNLPSEQRRHSSKIGQILLSSTFYIDLFALHIFVKIFNVFS